MASAHVAGTFGTLHFTFDPHTPHTPRRALAYAPHRSPARPLIHTHRHHSLDRSNRRPWRSRNREPHSRRCSAEERQACSSRQTSPPPPAPSPSRSRSPGGGSGCRPRTAGWSCGTWHGSCSTRSSSSPPPSRAWASASARCVLACAACLPPIDHAYIHAYNNTHTQTDPNQHSPVSSITASGRMTCGTPPTSTTTRRQRGGRRKTTTAQHRRCSRRGRPNFPWCQP